MCARVRVSAKALCEFVLKLVREIERLRERERELKRARERGGEE